MYNVSCVVSRARWKPGETIVVVNSLTDDVRWLTRRTARVQDSIRWTSNTPTCMCPGQCSMDVTYADLRTEVDSNDEMMDVDVEYDTYTNVSTATGRTPTAAVLIRTTATTKIMLIMWLSRATISVVPKFELIVIIITYCFHQNLRKTK